MCSGCDPQLNTGWDKRGCDPFVVFIVFLMFLTAAGFIAYTVAVFGGGR